MLCRTLKDPCGVEDGGQINGLGFFDAETIFEKEKVRTRVTGAFENVTGIFSNLNGKRFDGYEIHMGITKSISNQNNLTKIKTNDNKNSFDGLCKENVYGTRITSYNVCYTKLLRYQW